jgi:hypothetical protein
VTVFALSSLSARSGFLGHGLGRGIPGLVIPPECQWFPVPGPANHDIVPSRLAWKCSLPFHSNLSQAREDEGDVMTHGDNEIETAAVI